MPRVQSPDPLPLPARQTLRKLGKGGRLLSHGAAFRVGATPVAPATVEALQRADLIEADPAAGGFRLSHPGRAWLDRQGAPAGEGAYAQNRLIAQARRMIDGAKRPVTLNLATDPLVWLERRNLLNARQLAAAEQLRADFERAQLAPSVTMRWDAAPASRSARGAPTAPSPAESQLAAQRRFAAAVEAVGETQADLLWRVVCSHEGLETAEKAHGWSQRTAKVVLGLALDLLADHYRMPRSDNRKKPLDKRNAPAA
jgi:hypothetical protein